MFILVYALQTSKLYKKHLAGFETSCQHFGATSIKFLYVITQCVWDGEIVHAQEISHILEKVWISLFVKKKKKKKRLEIIKHLILILLSLTPVSAVLINF